MKDVLLQFSKGDRSVETHANQSNMRASLCQFWVFCDLICFMYLEPKAAALHGLGWSGPLGRQATVLFSDLGPARTLKSFQNFHLSEDMKNKRLLNPAEISPNYLLGHQCQRWAPRAAEGRGSSECVGQGAQGWDSSHLTTSFMFLRQQKA